MSYLGRVVHYDGHETQGREPVTDTSVMRAKDKSGSALFMVTLRVVCGVSLAFGLAIVLLAGAALTATLD